MSGNTELEQIISSEVSRLLSDVNMNTGLYRKLIDKVERVMIRHVLDHCDGNKAKASKLLGINRVTLAKKYERLHER